MPKSFPSMYTNLQHKIITSDDYEYHAFKMLQIKSKTFFFFLISKSEIKIIIIFLKKKKNTYIILIKG